MVILLSTQDNAKLLEKLKSRFKRTTNWSIKYEKILQDPYLNDLIDPSFWGGNRLFVLLFENAIDRTAHTKYYLPKEETKI